MVKSINVTPGVHVQFVTELSVSKRFLKCLTMIASGRTHTLHPEYTRVFLQLEDYQRERNVKDVGFKIFPMDALKEKMIGLTDKKFNIKKTFKAKLSLVPDSRIVFRAADGKNCG